MGDRIEIYDSNGNLIEVKDTRELSEEKEKIKLIINDYRDLILKSGMTWNNIKWDTNEISRQNINGIVTGITIGLPIPEPILWRDYNNITRQLSKNELIELAGSLLFFVQTCYEISWYHKNNIDNLNTIEELDMYDYKSGWPS